jgi:hypothetical protein
MVDRKIVQNTSMILDDLIDGDFSALSREELTNFDFNKIKLALDYLVNNDNLSESKKLHYINNSWKIYYKRKPPTPEEFVTEAWIGPLAEHIYPRVKETFIRFMDPKQPYRDLILYPHMGWGKEMPLSSRIFIDENSYKEMGDIKLGDKVLTPKGTQTEVVAIYPQGVKDVYELEMDDGRVVRCGLNHLWHISYRRDENGEKIWENVETKFLIENMNKYEFEIPDYPVSDDPFKIS